MGEGVGGVRQTISRVLITVARVSFRPDEGGRRGGAGGRDIGQEEGWWQGQLLHEWRLQREEQQRQVGVTAGVGNGSSRAEKACA